MKKEDQIISSLFEAARTEAPKVSFEQMAQQLNQQPPVPPTEPAGIGANIKHLLLKNIGLNSIILVVGAGLVYYGLKQPTPTPELAAIPGPLMVADSIPSAPSILPIAQPLKEAKAETSPSPILSSIDTQVEEEVESNFIYSSAPINSSPITQDSTATPATAQSTSTSEDKGVNKKPIQAAESPLPYPVKNFADSTNMERNPSSVPSSLQDEKGTLTTSKGTIEDHEKIDTSNILRTTSIVLLNTYNQDATGEFFTILTSYGFELKKKRHRFKDGQVRNILMHLTHREGLDYKLRAVRFKRIEVKLYFDQSDQLYGFSIHMNQQTKAPKIISLSAKGNIVHQYRY